MYKITRRIGNIRLATDTPSAAEPQPNFCGRARAFLPMLTFHCNLIELLEFQPLRLILLNKIYTLVVQTHTDNLFEGENRLCISVWVSGQFNKNFVLLNQAGVLSYNSEMAVKPFLNSRQPPVTFFSQKGV